MLAATAGLLVQRAGAPTARRFAAALELPAQPAPATPPETLAPPILATRVAASPWQARMRRQADGQIAPPAEVAQAVRAAVKIALEQEMALGRSGAAGDEAITQRDALLRSSRTGQYLAGGEQANRVASKAPDWQILTYGVIEQINAYDFDADGLECDVLVALRDTRFTIYDGTGHPVNRDVRRDGLWRYRARYDLADGLWKLAELREYRPGPG